MSTFQDVIDQDNLYKCDSCRETFKARDVVLENAADNIKILTPPQPFVYLDKDNKVMGGGSQPSKEKGDKILCCPHCNMSHLFGMDIVR